MKIELKFLLPLLLVAGACATATDTDEMRAVATLEGRSGSSATGIVTFTERADGTVHIRADFTNVPPGPHGFHVHEVGDCSAADASSAGGHFNPGGAPHAGPDAAQHHAGDLGNITATAAGSASAETVSTQLTVSPGPRSVVGRAVVLHADADDLQSQPSGAAGARIACGVANLAPGN